MRNNINTINTFEEYQRLTDEQKEFYHFDQLSKIDALYNKINLLHSGLDDKYSRKWVEKSVIYFFTMILIAFAGLVIAGVFPKT